MSAHARAGPQQQLMEASSEVAFYQLLNRWQPQQRSPALNSPKRIDLRSLATGHVWLLVYEALVVELTQDGVAEGQERDDGSLKCSS